MRKTSSDQISNYHDLLTALLSFSADDAASRPPTLGDGTWTEDVLAKAYLPTTRSGMGIVPRPHRSVVEKVRVAA